MDSTLTYCLLFVIIGALIITCSKTRENLAQQRIDPCDRCITACWAGGEKKEGSPARARAEACETACDRKYGCISRF